MFVCIDFVYISVSYAAPQCLLQAICSNIYHPPVSSGQLLFSVPLLFFPPLSDTSCFCHTVKISVIEVCQSDKFSSYLGNQLQRLKWLIAPFLMLIQWVWIMRCVLLLESMIRTLQRVSKIRVFNLNINFKAKHPVYVCTFLVFWHYWLACFECF